MTLPNDSERTSVNAPSAASVLTLEDLRKMAAHVSQAIADQGVGGEFEDEEVERLYSVALRLVGQADFMRANAVLTRVCDLRPGDVRYLRALATVRRELGFLEEAAKFFQVIDFLEPGNPRNGLDLAECWLRSGRSKEARLLLIFTEAFCEAHQVTGRVPERVQALLTLLDRQGGPDGKSDSARA